MSDSAVVLTNQYFSNARGSLRQIFCDCIMLIMETLIAVSLRYSESGN